MCKELTELTMEQMTVLLGGIGGGGNGSIPGDPDQEEPVTIPPPA